MSTEHQQQEALCTVEEAKEIAKELFKQYDFDQQGELGKGEIGPLINDIYKSMGIMYNPSIHDVESFAKEKEQKPGEWAYVRWPLQRQLMTRYLSLTCIVQGTIFLFVIINMNIIVDKTETETLTYLENYHINNPPSSQSKQESVQRRQLEEFSQNVKTMTEQVQNFPEIHSILQEMLTQQFQNQYKIKEINLSLIDKTSNKTLQTYQKQENTTKITDKIQQQIKLPQNQEIHSRILLERSPQQQQPKSKIKTNISELFTKQRTITYIICTLTSLASIGLVMVFTYQVAVTLARPLRKLISIASQINNNTIHNKALVKETMNKLGEMETEYRHQVKLLIKTFKNLLQNIEQRNRVQKPKQKKRLIDYPLNQYDPEYIRKAKGEEAEINWNVLVNQVKIAEEKETQKKQEQN